MPASQATFLHGEDFSQRRKGSKEGLRFSFASFFAPLRELTAGRSTHWIWLDLRFGRLAAAPEDTDHAREQAVEDVRDHDRQQHVLRIQEDQHPNRQRENDRAHAANACADGLEAREALGADHHYA